MLNIVHICLPSRGHCSEYVLRKNSSIEELINMSSQSHCNESRFTILYLWYIKRQGKDKYCRRPEFKIQWVLSEGISTYFISIYKGSHKPIYTWSQKFYERIEITYAFQHVGHWAHRNGGKFIFSISTDQTRRCYR